MSKDQLRSSELGQGDSWWTAPLHSELLQLFSTSLSEPTAATPTPLQTLRVSCLPVHIAHVQYEYDWLLVRKS